MLHDGRITTVEQLQRALLLVTTNAFIYNARNTQVYAEAAAFAELARRECEPLLVCGALKRRLSGQ